MPTHLHFRNPLLTVKTDDSGSTGDFYLDLEDHILKRLGSHARIVSYRGRDDATGALIFDTAPNGDVQRYLARHPDTSLDIRAKWCLQLAEGIVYLHSKHIIWADCNPSNLLLTSDLDILLCDFGGSSISGLPPSVCPGAVYSLPRLELVADHNIDIFAFGSVFFEIITQRMPYAELGFDEIRARYDSAIFPDIPDHIPGVFAGIVRKCWHLNYASSEELLGDMRSAYNAFCGNDVNRSAI